MASKYRSFERKEIQKKQMNPIWRGIGCVLFVVVPLISYLIMSLILPAVKGTGSVPPELLANATFPAWVYKAPILSSIALFLGTIPELWLKAVVFIVVLLLLATISSLIWSFVIQVAGPPRYTEMDAPDADRGAKAYKR